MKLVPKQGTKLAIRRISLPENGIPPVNVMNSGKAVQQNDRISDFEKGWCNIILVIVLLQFPHVIESLIEQIFSRYVKPCF